MSEITEESREILSEIIEYEGDGHYWKKLLPVVHNITMPQLKNKYPDIADIQAIDSKDHTCDQIALLFARQLIKRLK